MSDVQVVLCTFPDLPQARHIGTLLVEKQLAACVNLIPAVESIFCWEGKISSESEVLAVFKTTAECFVELERELLARHPYDVPELLALRVGAGSEAYLKWVRAETMG
ncbi:MAG TPA: divalent-cation tolerance protein CutA [Verrucomicrobiales bacterium]|nr:divalent-cation tolerance protein CutA [Verrucomicrobiales bacterium]